MQMRMVREKHIKIVNYSLMKLSHAMSILFVNESNLNGEWKTVYRTTYGEKIIKNEPSNTIQDFWKKR